MDFGGNKTPIEVINFRDIYSDVNNRLYKKSWKEFDESKNIDQNYYCSNY